MKLFATHHKAARDPPQSGSRPTKLENAALSVITHCNLLDKSISHGVKHGLNKIHMK
jgi:hypothetical protein